MIFAIPYHSRIDPIIVAIKIFVLLFYIYSAVRIYRKQQKTVNKFFAASFIAWALFIFFDLLVLIIAPINYTGYVISQIFWRIQLLTLFTLTFFIYNTSSIIISGTHLIKNRARVSLQIAILGIAYAIIAIFSSVIIVLNSGHTFNPKTDFPLTEGFEIKDKFGFSMIFFIIPLGYFLIASIKMGLASKKIENRELKKKVILTIIGNLMIPIGLIYYLIRDIIWTPDIINTLIGQIIYLLSPILISISQRTSSTE